MAKKAKKREDIEDVIRMGVRVAARYRQEGIVLRWTLHYDPAPPEVKIMGRVTTTMTGRRPPRAAHSKRGDEVNTMNVGGNNPPPKADDSAGYANINTSTGCAGNVPSIFKLCEMVYDHEPLCKEAAERIRELEARWSDPRALQVRLMELFQKNPSPEAVERLVNWVEACSRLSEMSAQELVNLSLEHLSEDVSNQAFEQVVEELCTRVYPNWINEGQPQSDGGVKT